MDLSSILTRAYISSHTLSAARIFEGLVKSEQEALLNMLPPAVSAQLMVICDPVFTVDLISSLAAERAAQILDGFPINTAVSILRKTEQLNQTKIIERLPQPKGEDVKHLMIYPADCAGALMDPRVLTFPDDISVQEAKIRLSKKAGHIIYYIYVLDRAQKLKGFLNIRDLFLAGKNEMISSIRVDCSWVLRPFQRIGQILNNPGWREVHVLPVVDEQFVFLGAIGYRTLREIEIKDKAQKNEHSFKDVSTALGELYWFSVSGLLRGFSLGPDKSK